MKEIRESPFNLKGWGWGGYGFSKENSVSKFDGKNYLVSDMGSNNILFLSKALDALKNCFCRKK